MKNRILHLCYLFLAKIPDTYFFDKYLQLLRGEVLNLQTNKHIEKGSKISTNVKIWSSTKLKVGKYSFIKDNVILNGDITLGNYSQILSSTFIDGTGKVVIGSYTQIGRENHIYSHNHDIYNKNQKMIYSKEIFKPVFIGDDVMLFSRVSVMAGVKIEDGTAIAHGSIVTKDTDKNYIYAGNPIKKIGERK